MSLNLRQGGSLQQMGYSPLRPQFGLRRHAECCQKTMQSLRTRGTLSMTRSIIRVALATLLAAGIGQSAIAQIAPTSPTTTWAPILSSGGTVPDPINDQQT